jgi:hypothetical protein
MYHTLKRDALATTAAALVFASVAWAGSAHFVGDVTVTRTFDSLDVAGKEAGLGGLAQVHIVVTATASCINPGQHHPKAANKESLSAGNNFPVQNGKADFALIVTAVFSPECSPPMTVVFTDVEVTDTTNNISQFFPGPF